MKVSQKLHSREDWINGRRWHWWRALSPRGLRYNRPLLMLLIVVIVIGASVPLSLFMTPRAAALSSVGPDPNDYRTNGGIPRQVAYQVDNTPYAGVTSLNILIYFTDNTTNSVTIHSPGLTDTVPYDSTYPGSNISGNPVVTTFTLQSINSNGSVGAVVASGTSLRNDSADKTIVVPNGSLVIDPITKYYILQFTATINTAYSLISNGFWLSSSGADVIGQDSKSNATSFAMHAPATIAEYTNWNLRFGADCDVQSSTPKLLSWFDADNGDPTTQPIKYTFTLYDETALANVPFTRITDNSDGTIFLDAAQTIVQPGSANRMPGSVEFIAQPYHKYIWKMNNVYSDNVLQFKKPFNDIYYKTSGCPRFTVQPDITGLPAYFTAGVSYTGLSAVGKNLGPDPSQPFNMTITTNTGTLTGTTTNTTTQADLAVGSSFTFTFGIDIPAGAPNGSSICITNTVNPANEKKLPASVQRCRPIFRVYTPDLVGRASDVHAGGGVCSLAAAPGTGNIIGNSSGGSMGEYVVSSEGTTTSFGSNGGGTGATLSRYQSVCRPDLVKVAQDAIAATPVIAYKPGPSYTGSYAALELASLLAGKDVVYVPGNVTLTGGTVNRNLTIFAGGTVTINGNLVRSGASLARASQPSLGIIAAGDINITGASTTADAYFFSNGNINTCSVGPCNNTLNVHGFLMATSMRLIRQGPTTATATCPTSVTVGECVIMTGQLYLNPPAFFDNSLGLNRVQSQGERPPVN